jgi:hypothetical protein
VSTRANRRKAARCCPACAASVGRRRRHGPPPWAWPAALASLAALVPVAAAQDADQPRVIEDEPSGGAASAPAPEPAHTRPAPAPRAPDDGVRWHDSVSHGTPNAGWLEDGVRLPASGPGFYTYDPATQLPPGGDQRRWGNDLLVREVIDLGRWWQRRHPNGPRLGIGDLSRPSGGAFHGPVVGHLSHQNGLDVDIRLVRADGAEERVGAAEYDRELTQQVVDRLVARGAALVLVGPSLDISGPPGVVVTWPNHDDHLHARFPNPGLR